MRYKKKELIKLIGSLAEVNDAIIKNFSRLDTEVIIEALTECQETAITIGTYFEEKELVEIVHILEDYCEMIYQMTLVLSDPNQVKKLAKKMPFLVCLLI